MGFWKQTRTTKSPVQQQYEQANRKQMASFGGRGKLKTGSRLSGGKKTRRV